ncbi:uncharacterized protein LOC143248706 isoform X2 [Tachypleus tridentatus]|uniref:uncharacterized protein LOC143248706 isoform X2 n=1 Tax=Tachypleus tridentatus TaxID=6853 RepID=UPI003FD599C6
MVLKMTEKYNESWHIPCSVSLASCRLTAEALARKLHCKLWDVGRFDFVEGNDTNDELDDDIDDNPAAFLTNSVYSKYRPSTSYKCQSTTPIIDKAPQPQKKVYGANDGTSLINSKYMKDKMLGSEEEDDFEHEYSSPLNLSEENALVDSLESLSTLPVLVSNEISQVSSGVVKTNDTAHLKSEITEASMQETKSEKGMDISEKQLLYEKLQMYAQKWSVTDDKESCCSEGMGGTESNSENDEFEFGKGINIEPCNLQDYEEGGNMFLISQPQMQQIATNASFVHDSKPEIFVSPRASSTWDSGIISPEETAEEDQDDSEQTKSCRYPEETETGEISVSFSDITGKISEEVFDEITDIKEHNDKHELKSDSEVNISVAFVDETRKSTLCQTSSVESSTEVSLSQEVSLDLDCEMQKEIYNWSVIDDYEEDDMRYIPGRLKRSSSLKTGKTPPGTPHKPKIVRFADALGLDLEAVRHIVSDDAPNIPASAFNDLKISDQNFDKQEKSTNWTYFPVRETFIGSSIMHTPSQCARSLVPLFSQPGGEGNFLDRVRMEKVCLENVVVSDMNVQCHVRVLNISFDKKVVARYTTNDWMSYEDILANYVQGSCDGFSDKFSFNIFVPHMCDGQQLQFAVRYVTNGQEFWDNNWNQNYILRCHGNISLVSTEEEETSWLHHFM